MPGHATLRTVAVIQPTTAIGNSCPAPAVTQPVPIRFGNVDTMPPAGQTVTIVSGILLPYPKVSEIIDSKLSAQGESSPGAEISLGDPADPSASQRT